LFEDNPKEGVEIDSIYEGRGNAAELPGSRRFTAAPFASKPCVVSKMDYTGSMFIETNGTAPGRSNKSS